MPTLDLIRHCSAVDQEPDALLTEDGHAQSLLLHDFFSELTIDRIISSDYTRAVTSVTPLADAHHLSIEREPLLRERILSHEPLEDWLTPFRQSFSIFGQTNKPSRDETAFLTSLQKTSKWHQARHVSRPKPPSA